MRQSGWSATWQAWLARPRSVWQHATAFSHFGSRFALTLLTDLTLAIVGLTTGLLSARLLGPSGRGELAAIQSWPQFLAILSHLGVNDALAYYGARDPNKTGRWLSTAMILALTACLLFGVAGYWLMPYLLASQPGIVVQTARDYLWYLPLAVVVSLPAYCLRGRNDLVAWNFHRFLPPVTWATVIAICLLGRLSAAATLARLYLVAFAGVMLSVTAILTWNRVPRPFRPERALVRPLLTYGLPAFLSSIPATLNMRLDQMLIAALVGPRVLGLYVVAVSWSMAGSLVMNALAGAALPRMASITDPAQQATTLAQTTRLGLSLAMIVALGTTLTAPLAIPWLFGQAFATAIPAAFVLAPAASIASFNQLLTTGALSVGKPQFTLAGEGIGLFVAAVALWILLTPYGLIGAAVASLLSYAATSITLLWLLKRQTGRRLVELLWLNSHDLHLLRQRLRTLIFGRRPTVLSPGAPL